MVKIARCLTIEHDVYEQARKKHINISAAAEFGIRSALNMKEIDDKVKDMNDRVKSAIISLSDDRISRCRADLKHSKSFANKWIKIIENISGEKLSRDEIIEVFG